MLFDHRELDESKCTFVAYSLKKNDEIYTLSHYNYVNRKHFTRRKNIVKIDLHRVEVSLI